MRLILLGPPAVGKGTQAEKISRHYGLPHISTGEILRQNIADRTPLGLEAAKLIDNGQLAPDDLVIKIIKDRLKESDCKKGWLLDGFPRTVAQAEGLDGFCPPDAVIELTADAAMLIQRVTGRLNCKKCAKIYHVTTFNGDRCDCGGELYRRSDDDEATFVKRLEAYARQTKPLTDYYLRQGNLLCVDGTANIENVFQLVKSALDRS